MDDRMHSTKTKTRPSFRAEPGSAGTGWLVVCAVAAFGPSLGSGVRLEQLVVYSTALVLAPIALRRRMAAPLGAALGVWSAYVFVSLASTAGRVPGVNRGEASLLAGLDTLLLPLALLVVVAAVVSDRSARDLSLDRLSLVVPLMVCANSMLAAASAVGGWSDQVLSLWGEGQGSVAAVAAAQGRYGGIFNQPAEAGAAYAIGLHLAVYRWTTLRPDSRRLLVATLVITLGAALAASKVFLLAGVASIIVVAVVGRARTVHRLRRLGLVGLALVAAVAGVWLSGVTAVGDFSQLSELFQPSQFGVDVATGGRLGSDGLLAEWGRVVLDESPIVGVGLFGADFPYDSLWLEAMVYAGLVGVILNIWLFAVLIRTSTGLTTTPQEDSGFVKGFVVLLILASVGIPILTINRVATMVWLVIGVALLTRGSDRPHQRHEHVQSRMR
jgi:hypothetical protein